MQVAFGRQEALSIWSSLPVPPITI